MTDSLPKALDAERRELNGRSGRLSYYVKGSGRPLLLLHSINAAGSAYEIKPVYDAMTDDYTVYAPDLPGFGFSDRSNREYSIGLYVDAVRDMLDQIKTESEQPVDALALSLSSEFAARAARDEPDRFNSLALVTPTGFRRGSHKLTGEEGETREMAPLTLLGKIPGLRSALFRLLVRPRSIRYFLKRTWGSKNFDEGLAAYDDHTTHQPGAENAPLAFLSGRLFAADIRRVYAALDLPVWVPHGNKGDFGDFSESEWAEQRGNWALTEYDTGALPHFEVTERFVDDFRAFLAKTR